MESTSILTSTLKELARAMSGDMSGTQLESIQATIKKFAIASAVANAIGGAIPGGVSVVASLVQTGMVVATFIQINRILNVSVQENIVKVMAVAFATGLVANASTMIVYYAAAAVISFIPIWGSAVAATASAAMGYIYIYVAAVVYLKLITNFVQPDGSIRISTPDEAKRIINDIMQKTDLSSIIKEGSSSYKQAEGTGEIEKAMKNPRCPSCGAKINKGQKFCSECGTVLC